MPASTMDNMFALSGRVLVTGGTGGIGRAISLCFARAAASVIASYVRNQKAADDFKATADQEGLSLQLCRADVTSPQGVEQIEGSVQDGGEPLTGLVYCAATGVHRVLSELTTRQFDWMFALNVRAFFELTKALLSRFAEDPACWPSVQWASSVPCRTIP